MNSINDLVRKTIKTGYLTIEAEEQLRKLLAAQYDLEDLNAFVALQEAAMTGQVKQESRERLEKSGKNNKFVSPCACDYAIMEQW